MQKPWRLIARLRSKAVTPVALVPLLLLLVARCLALSPDQKTLLGFKESQRQCSLYHETAAFFSSWNASSLNASSPEWAGVTFGDNWTVLALNASSANLCGPLADSWGNLLNMTTLDLSSNDLTGSLPDAWSKLVRLGVLKVASNSLNGPVPEAWSKLVELSSLDLSDNSLNGTLPEGWGKLVELSSLDLSDNSLNGTLPEGWGKLVKLSSLDLSDNSLNGPLPEAWSKLVKLGALGLSRNNFTGPLPPSWSRLQNLVDMALNDNTLTGILPSAWSTFNHLTALNLANNILTGTLPRFTSDSMWTTLTHLNAAGNQLQGPIPSALASSASIIVLNLSHNSLSGSLPAALPRQLVYLNLASNNFIGAVPGRLLKSSSDIFSDLTFLLLDNNQLTALPSASFFAAFPRLLMLSVSNNFLVGVLQSEDVQRLPPDLCYCDLSHNNISGSIPLTWATHHWIYLSLHHNQLTGRLPDWQGNISTLLLQHNKLSGGLPWRFRHIQQLLVLDASSNQLGCRVVSASGICLSRNEKGDDSFVPPTWLQPGVDTTQGSECSPPTILKLYDNPIPGCIPGDLFTPVLPWIWLKKDKAFSAISCPKSSVQLGLSPQCWHGKAPKKLATFWLSGSAGRTFKRFVCMREDGLPRLRGLLLDGKNASALSQQMDSIAHAIIQRLEVVIMSANHSRPLALLHIWGVEQRGLLHVLRTKLQPDHASRELPDLYKLLCTSSSAKWIVMIQFGALGGGSLVLLLLYWTAKRYDWVHNCRHHHTAGLTFVPLSWQERLMAFVKSVKACMTNRVLHGILTAGKAVFLTLDFSMDVVVVAFAWGHWPASVFLASMLVSSTIACALLIVRILQMGYKSTALVVFATMPVMPALRCILLAFKPVGVDTCVAFNLQGKLARYLPGLQWSAVFDLLDITGAVFMYLPQSIVLAIIFLSGNHPRLGLYTEAALYSMFFGTVDLLKVLLVVLWEALNTQQSPWVVIWHMATYKMVAQKADSTTADVDADVDADRDADGDKRKLMDPGSVPSCSFQKPQQQHMNDACNVGWLEDPFAHTQILQSSTQFEFHRSCQLVGSSTTRKEGRKGFMTSESVSSPL